MASVTSGFEEAYVSGVWDLRDELRVDGLWKQKCDILSEVYYETVLQGLNSSHSV